MATVKMEALCRLVRFEATDDYALSGLLYEPVRRTKRAIVWLHGTGGASIFDSRRTNILGAEFTARGFAYFPFNNRGAHLMRRNGGMAYERIRDCVHDIDGALREIRRRGYRDITLAGHSTGANKIAVYDHRKPRNHVKRYVLLAGGDDTGATAAMLGRRFEHVLTLARDRKNSEELVPVRFSPLPMSWRSFYDMNNPDGDYNVFPFGEIIRRKRLSRKPLFRYVRAIRKPSLYIYGEHDEYCYDDVPRCAAILSEHVGPSAEIVIMEDADHGFGGKEPELAELISGWAQ